MGPTPQPSGYVPSEELGRLHVAVGFCNRCPELVASRSRVVPGDGNPQAKIMFVGEGPGEQEDKRGVPFVGPAGQLLNRCLGEIGLERKDVFITNIVKCRPPGNRVPKDEEVEQCREWLYAQLLLVNPAVVCPLGSPALKTLLGKDRSITRDHGRAFRLHGITFFPIFHPAAALHQSDRMEDLFGDFLALRAHLVSEGHLVAG
ncbi:MAG TPA: uracil-DNA glycosylase [bacterium]|nr:uracil-DNA glycosylase [bacterium]